MTSPAFSTCTSLNVSCLASSGQLSLLDSAQLLQKAFPEYPGWVRTLSGFSPSPLLPSVPPVTLYIVYLPICIPQQTRSSLGWGKGSTTFSWAPEWILCLTFFNPCNNLMCLVCQMRKLRIREKRCNPRLCAPGGSRADIRAALSSTHSAWGMLGRGGGQCPGKGARRRLWQAVVI